MVPTLPTLEPGTKSLVLLSGGMDSAVALGWLASGGNQVRGMYVEYGQKTNSREKECCQALCRHYALPAIVTTSIPLLQSLDDHPMMNPATRLDTVRPTLAYVPFRNTIMLALAAAWAEYNDYTHVVIGSHASDRVCLDNSPQYIQAFQTLVDIAQLNPPNLCIEAPFAKWTKSQIVSFGVQLDVPLDFTWSCYNETEKACGICGNCRDRLTAFNEAGLKDPLPYKEG